jgi:cellulose synthase/poly-beta-1,6-N-acetylglucosamine synthase-like glycosyltransferase
MEQVFEIFNGLFLVFGVSMLTAYLVLGVLSVLEIRHYRRKNSFVDYHQILISNEVPSVSIIAPAYNESATIIENINSLLSIQYPKGQVIIVNDGSKDDTLQKVIREFDLVAVNYHHEQQIPTKKVRAVYKARNPAFARLLVIDKENGGKADALNVGLNLSSSELVACIDVDCMLAEDALLKMVKPFLEGNKRKVIAVGGAIKVANSCVVKKGRLLKANLPERFLPKAQILEYTRAFLMGRMGWSRINGLMLISGAFGLFDRKVAVAAGGYDPATVGEDMELVVRMRKYMEQKKEKYKVSFIPDPLCWTEVPEDRKILGSQRNRWTRGTIETLWIHRRLFFNPRYRILGLLSYPFWFFFEWMAPIIETLGVLYFIFLLFSTGVHWLFFISLLAAVYLFAVMFTAWSLLTEDSFFEKYPKTGDMFRLIGVSLVEPLLYHPFVIWHSIKGNWTKLRGKNVKWGQMERKGFTKAN